MFLKIEGKIDGAINGTEFSAVASGFLDTSGGKMNHFELSFIDKLPDNFNPIVASNCWNSSYHPVAMLPLNDNKGATNLFPLINGEYITSRTVKYPTLGIENFLEFKSNVFVKDGVISTTSSTVSGTYNGPLDVIGVVDYNQVWKQGTDGKSVEIDITANLKRVSGELIPVKITTRYSGFDSKRMLNEQKSKHIYGNEKWDGRIMSFDWVGVIY